MNVVIAPSRTLVWAILGAVAGSVAKRPKMGAALGAGLSLFVPKGRIPILGQFGVTGAEGLKLASAWSPGKRILSGADGAQAARYAFWTAGQEKPNEKSYFTKLAADVPTTVDWKNQSGIAVLTWAWGKTNAKRATKASAWLLQAIAAVKSYGPAKEAPAAKPSSVEWEEGALDKKKKRKKAKRWAKILTQSTTRGVAAWQAAKAASPSTEDAPLDQTSPDPDTTETSSLPIGLIVAGVGTVLVLGVTAIALSGRRSSGPGPAFPPPGY
jgi:hypothetical protein